MPPFKGNWVGVRLFLFCAFLMAYEMEERKEKSVTLGFSSEGFTVLNSQQAADGRKHF